VIRFEGVTKRFGKKVVLDRLDLEIPTGSTTAIIGFSGSGKSVALKHVAGLLTPDQGSVTVDGAVVHELDADALRDLRARIGYVFQFAALLDSLTVGDNIRLGFRRRDIDAEEVERRVRESLAVVELTEAMNSFPANLSGGMRKRIGIARAIALAPDYILFDEPTTGLDPVTTATMDHMMLRVRRDSGATCVIVSHDMKSVFGVADRVAMLHDGRIRQVGSAEEMRSSEDPIVRDFIAGRTDAFLSPGTRGTAA
jgi:phospholipid/cholesterol/gamma-HCH transport system ATP-binding protein